MTPSLSYIVLTDVGATIQPLIEYLQRQTVAERIELVVVTPSRQTVVDALENAIAIGRVLVVEFDIGNYAAAEAAGIMAASAPYGFIGETHSFPHPQFCEVLLRTFHSGPWTIVAPGVENANPCSPWSWSGYLSDYATWSATWPEGDCLEAPLYNGAYDLRLLKAFGTELEVMLARGNALPLALRAGGNRARFQPAARLAHVNIALPRDWIRERILTGHLVAANRIAKWNMARRLVYLVGCPLIALEMFRRVLPGSWRTIRILRLSPLLLLFILAAMVLRAWGEFLGYLGVASDQAEQEMIEYEIHKLAYAGPMVRREF